MRVVVTGGSGRVGQVTVAGLTAVGHEVLVLDTVAPPPDGVTGVGCRLVSTEDYAELLAACSGTDAIVHLAGIPNPLAAPAHVVHRVNVNSTYNVLCAAVELGIGRVVLASSVNAVGMTWSRGPRFDYFPVDTRHPTRNEDAYSLSKWVGEQQADSIVRLNPQLSVVSIRLHMFMSDRAEALAVHASQLDDGTARGLWGYTTHRMWLEACEGAVSAELNGHHVFFVVADRTVSSIDSGRLASEHYPTAAIRGNLRGTRGFFDCADSQRILGWSGRD